MNANPQRFHPYRSKGWFPVIAGVVVFLLGALLVWGVTGEDKQPINLNRAIAMIMLMLINPLTWFGLWLIGLGVGIWRAFVAVTDEGLELYAHRFSMWSIRRRSGAKLAWSQVAGVQPFSLTNMLAPDGVQREFIVYTSAGKFILPELLWPDAREIAEQISSRIGKPMGDLSAVTEPIIGKRPADLRGARIMHGIGWFAQFMGWAFAALAIVAAFGGYNLRSTSYVVMMAMGLVLTGASLRRFHMG